MAKHTLIEVIRTTNREPLVEEAVKASGTGGGWQNIEIGRSKIAQEIFENAQKRLTDLGIALLDIRFKRINYNNDVQRKIFDRMISERKQIAGKFQAEGQGEAARILGEKERDLKKAQSEAYRQVLEIRGKADASASEIYAKAYNQNPQACDFYQFLKTMETYQAALDANTTLILTPETDFFKYLKSPFTPASAAK